MRSLVPSKNVSWLRLFWPTLYTTFRLFSVSTYVYDTFSTSLLASTSHPNVIKIRSKLYAL